MTNILKPFGRGKVLTEEEVVAQLESYVPPGVETPENIVVPSTDIVTPKNLGEIVDFYGYDLVRNEYDALTGIAQTYFQKSAEDYFSNLDTWVHGVYLEIDDQHVTRLDIRGRDLSEIPVEVGELTELISLYLDKNQISKIENLDNLLQLQVLYFPNNLVDYDLPDNQTEYRKLRDRGVMVWK